MNATRSSENLCFYEWELRGLDELDGNYSNVLRVTNFVLSVVICVIGYIGNVIVICATGLIMKKHQSKIWFLNLAIADFVFLLFLPLNAVAGLKANWPFGTPFCKMYNFLSIANMYASIFIITALNIDRALAIANPMWHHRCFSQWARYCICAAIWSVTVLASVPAIIFARATQTKEKTECSVFNTEGVEFEITQFLQYDTGLHGFYTEIVNIFNQYVEKCQGYQCCATEKSLIIWNQMVFSAKCLVIPLLVIAYVVPLCVIFTSNIIIALEVRKSKKVKSSRLYRIVITIFIVHFVTWTPLVVAQIIFLVAVQNTNIILVYKVVMFLPLLSTISFISSCLNPIMYLLVGSQVRRECMGFLSNVSRGLSTGS